MLPREIAKTTVTVYNYIEIPQEESAPKITYTKEILKDCIWKQDSHSTYKSTGTLNADAVTLLIPFTPTYFSTQSEELYVGDGWTIQLGVELKGTYIVKGVCDYVFPINGTDPTTLFNDYIKPFESAYRYRRPKEIIENFVGTKGLWFIEVRC